MFLVRAASTCDSRALPRHLWRRCHAERSSRGWRYRTILGRAWRRVAGPRWRDKVGASASLYHSIVKPELLAAGQKILSDGQQHPRHCEQSQRTPRGKGTEREIPKIIPGRSFEGQQGDSGEDNQNPSEYKQRGNASSIRHLPSEKPSLARAGPFHPCDRRFRPYFVSTTSREC
jgi:hypothetical protein